MGKNTAADGAVETTTDNAIEVTELIVMAQCGLCSRDSGVRSGSDVL